MTKGAAQSALGGQMDFLRSHQYLKSTNRSKPILRKLTGELGICQKERSDPTHLLYYHKGDLSSKKKEKVNAWGYDMKVAEESSFAH